MDFLNFRIPPYMERQQMSVVLDEKDNRIGSIFEILGAHIERLKELRC